MDITKTHYAYAVFGGGCFWCMEPPYSHIPGVIDVIPGYMGGNVVDPTYELVSSGTTGHVEVVRITYDPQKVSYEELLDIFWRNIDPTTPNGQFADLGPQYRTVIFYYDDAQKNAAEKSKQDLEKSGKFKSPVVTSIEKAKEFYPAEEYHRAYYRRNPTHYQNYKEGSGRSRFLKQVWGEHITNR